jgi:hypothetical protein
VSEAEVLQTIRELKAILQDALAILDGKEKPLNRDVIR